MSDCALPLPGRLVQSTPVKVKVFFRKVTE